LKGGLTILKLLGRTVGHKMGIERLLVDAKVAAVICNQWGDTGKGKVVDLLSYWADVIVRGTGGANAGHTTVIDGKQRIFHLIPAGIVYDGAGKMSVLGNGMVINPFGLEKEMDELDVLGQTYNNLRVSRDAHVVLPFHIRQDMVRNQSQKDGGIGSTGKGIGPCYTDKTARRGVRMFEYLDADLLRGKLENLKKFYPDQDVMVEKVIEDSRSVAQRLEQFVCNTDDLVQNAIRGGQRVLLEGAQGLLLSINHGTFPYVTSSDCSLAGTASGAGINPKDIDLPIGIVKFPFMTRVGGGPFPTEIGGRRSEKYCGEGGHEVLDELGEYGIESFGEGGDVRYDSCSPIIIEMMNSDDPFERGVGIRLAAREYGATTGRPRRVGWTDAVAAKYAVGINGPLMVLTKPDCMAGAKEFNLCVGYVGEEGPTREFRARDETFLRGARTTNFAYEGYGDISDVREYDKLPKSLTMAIRDFEGFTGGSVIGVSNGAEREAFVVR